MRSSQTSASGEDYQQKLQDFVDELKGMPVAVQTLAANEQHYEVQWLQKQLHLLPSTLLFLDWLYIVRVGLQVPTEYFLLCLGKRLKYSSCLYPRRNTTLDEAEEAMLRKLCLNSQMMNSNRNAICPYRAWLTFLKMLQACTVSGRS